LLIVFGLPPERVYAPFVVLIAAQVLRTLLGNSEAFLLMASRQLAELISIAVAVALSLTAVAIFHILQQPLSILGYAAILSVMIASRAFLSFLFAARTILTLSRRRSET